MCLVQTLVVVANIQIRGSKAEVEQGSMCTAVGHVRRSCETGVAPITQVLREISKGNGVNIPEPGRGYCMATQENSVTQEGALGSVVFSF